MASRHHPLVPPSATPGSKSIRRRPPCPNPHHTPSPTDTRSSPDPRLPPPRTPALGWPSAPPAYCSTASTMCPSLSNSKKDGELAFYGTNAIGQTGTQWAGSKQLGGRNARTGGGPTVAVLATRALQGGWRGRAQWASCRASW